MTFKGGIASILVASAVLSTSVCGAAILNDAGKDGPRLSRGLVSSWCDGEVAIFSPGRSEADEYGDLDLRGCDR